MFIKKVISGSIRRCMAYYLVHMTPYTPELKFPIENYEVNGDFFNIRCSFSGVDWGVHLGEDCNRPPGTPVKAIGCGKVVYYALHAGRKQHLSWGHLVVIAHKNPDDKKSFFSVYGHICNVLVKRGDLVDMGQVIGEIAPPLTPQNGWWKDPHLHLGIYVGPWIGQVLPGYYREDQGLTKPEFWLDPSIFIATYG